MAPSLLRTPSSGARGYGFDAFYAVPMAVLVSLGCLLFFLAALFVHTSRGPCHRNEKSCEPEPGMFEAGTYRDNEVDL